MNDQHKYKRLENANESIRKREVHSSKRFFNVLHQKKDLN